MFVGSPDSPGFSGEMVTKGSEEEEIERESKTMRPLWTRQAKTFPTRCFSFILLGNKKTEKGRGENARVCTH